MSARGRLPLPNSMTLFCAAMDGVAVPTAVAPVMSAIQAAWEAESGKQKPFVVLNRAFGQLRRQHPNIFHEFADWLAKPGTRNTACKGGAHWAWAECCKAADKLMTGSTATVAFGANGRAKSPSFSVYEDAAMLAERRHRFVASSQDATKSVGDLRGDQKEQLDHREIQRQRARLRATGISPTDVAKQAEIVRIKYSKERT